MASTCVKSQEFLYIPLLSSDGTTSEFLKLTINVVGVEVDSVSLRSGPFVGGTAVTIHGCGFTDQSMVTFGGVAATNVTVTSLSSITATIPAGVAGTASLVVTTPEGSSPAKTLHSLLPFPAVSAISPASGDALGGTAVTISGLGFTGATGVTIGGQAATGVTVVNDTTITATTPAGTAGTASVLVSTAGGVNAANSLFAYVAGPHITSISPTSGPTAGGTVVTIIGTGFTGANYASFDYDDATDIHVISDTEMTATTPASEAVVADVQVTTPNGTTLGAGLFTYVAPTPTVTAITPNTGPAAGGTVVTITGAGFTGQTAVTIGGAAAFVTVESDTSITASTPAGTAGLASVVVTTAGGSNVANTLYTYAKAAQTVSFPTVSAAPVFGSTFQLAATSTSGLAVSFTSTTPDVCTVSGTTATPLQAGACIISAAQLGDATYAAATPVSQTFNVQQNTNPQLPQVSNGSLPDGTVGVAYNEPLTASGGCSGPYRFWVYAANNNILPTGLSIVGSAVVGTPTQSGSFLVEIQVEDACNHYTYPSKVRLTIAPAAVQAQTITFNALASVTYAPGLTVDLSTAATASSGLAVSYTSGSTSVCTVSGTTATILGAGTCILKADQPGNASYAPASQVSQNLVANQASQTISFTSQTPTNPVVGRTYTPAATGGASSSPLVISASGTCSIASGVIAFNTAGSCLVSADQAGDANYLVAMQAQQSITVGKAAQVVTFTQPPAQNYTQGGTVILSAKGGASNNPVTFVSNSTGVCTVSGATVTIVSAGTCSITASQAGNGSYAAAADETRDITINKATQIVTFTASGPTSALVGGSYTPTANGGASTLPVVISASGTCTLASGLVSFNTSGTCILNANQAGDANYLAAAQAQISFVIGKSHQSIIFTPPPTQLMTAGSVDLSATATSNLGVTYVSTSLPVCTVSGTTVTFVSVGTCFITASQAGDTNNLAAPDAFASFDIGQAPQVITFVGPITQSILNGSAALNASATPSGLTVTFASTTQPVCTVSGTTVNFVSAGHCIVTASQAGDGNYNPATDVQQAFNITQATQVISFTPLANQAFSSGGTVDLSATGGASGNPVTFASTDTSVCTTGSTNGTTVTFVRAGLCPITASQAGNANYVAAPDVAMSFTIGKATQVISFTTTPPSNQQVGGTYSVAASATPSGLPVKLAIDSASSAMCSLSGNTVSFTGAGACQIDATQAGDGNYNAANTAQSFAITLVPTSISLQVSPTSVVLGQSVTLTATVSPAVSSGAVSFSDGSNALCPAVTPMAGVATCTISFSTAGTHDMSASFSGNQAKASSTSTPVAIQPVDQKIVDGKAVGSFVSDRSNMIVSNMFDMGRQIDRLNQAQQFEGGDGGSGNLVESSKGDLAPIMQSSRLGGPSATSITSASLGAKTGTTDVGNQDVMAFQSFLYNYLKAAGQSGNANNFNLTGPLDMQANFGNGQGTASFKTSLSQIANWQQQHDKTEMNDLGFGHNMASGVFMPLDIWAEGNYATYSGNRAGQFGMVTLGADYVFNPSLLLGVYSQFDMMNQTSGTAISGNGFMVGPYATARLGDNVFWQARGGWGTSNNTINGADTFGSTRWMVSSSISGRWKSDNGLAFSPSASFTYFEDNSNAYLDSFGIAIPGTKTTLGQLKLSPELSYGFATDSGLWIEPNIATDLIWNFASTNIDGQGQLDGSATGPTGLRGKVKAGINFKTPSGISIGATGAYDGIGSQGFSSISGQATVNVPLN